MVTPLSRRDLMRGAMAAAAAGVASRVAATPPRRLADAGWCWDGQGFNGGVNPSIFGAGEGTRWFGLARCCYMFHPNNDLALEKLAGFEEVVCEISKWKVRRCENGVAHVLDGSMTTKTEEAAQVAALASRYPNVRGAIDDDLLGIIKREKITPEQYAAVGSALKKDNPALKLWTVVYTRELAKANWTGFPPTTDVISLWESHPDNLPNLPRHIDECREIFPGKPINIGCYLRDFRRRQGLAMDMLKLQWKLVRKYVDEGTVHGYSILGGFLIDMHPEQARWVRDFIRAN